MSTSVRVLRLSLADSPVHDSREWITRVRLQLERAARPVTLFGRAGEDPHDAVLTAVLQLPGGELEAVRGRVVRERGYHTLTRDFPAFHCFEREVHEQLGVRIADHPWLKPIRFEGVNAGKVNEYPFYKLEGKEVHEVNVGPIHAGVIEPGAFRFMCLGEIVHHLEIHLGYQHRGAERLLLQGDPRTKAMLVETIAGDTSIAHAWAYCAAIESLARHKTPPSVDLSRLIALELERIAMHLAGLAGLATDIGFLQGASTYGRLRTTAINTSMRLCGSRFGRGWLRPGGAQAVMDAALSRTVRANLDLLRNDVRLVNELFLGARSVQHRFQGIGVVTRTQALDVGLVGMAARASGVRIDQRDTGLWASAIAVDPVVEQSGDCWARACVRIREIDASLAFLGAALDRTPVLEAERAVLGELEPDAMAIAICEGWRGEVVHAVETGAGGSPRHYKIQDPSLRNWFGLALAVRENEISDFPICNKSFDLSYCGNDL